MKRLDAVKKLDEFLYERNLHPKEETIYELLEFLTENLGMLPPRVYNETSDFLDFKPRYTFAWED